MELLTSLTDKQFLISTQDLISKERALTTQILHQINEIEARRLHSKIGFSSLHECLVKHFHYSDGAAHRRISAARLLKRLPDAVVPALEQGQVNLTTIAAVQDFLVAEKKDFKKIYTAAETEKLITSIAGKSRTQCEQVFQDLSPQRAHAPRPEFARTVQAQGLEIRFTADQALQAKLTRLREILSHHPDVTQSYAALIDTMATKLLKRMDPLTKPNLKVKSQPQEAQTIQTTAPYENNALSQTRASSKKLAAGTWKRCYISKAKRQKVHEREQGRCSFLVEPNLSDAESRGTSTDIRCTARRFLHIDHIIPIALGGTSELNNLRLLCSAHNQTMAVRILGWKIMAAYLTGAKSQTALST